MQYHQCEVRITVLVQYQDPLGTGWNENEVKLELAASKGTELTF